MGFIIDPLPEEDVAQFETARQTLPPLLHDLTQLLLLLCRYPPIQLLHGRWLPRTALGQLAERLITPAEITGRTTHKQAPYLRNLMFWAAACDLIDNGRLTPTAWRWMAQEPAACLHDLWSAWQTTAVDIRFVFRQPDAFWSDALRRAFRRKLDASRGIISAARLADQLLEDEQISPADFAANFETISDFDASVSACLDDVMVDLGIVQPAADADSFRLTSLGDRVLNKAPNLLSDWTWKNEAILRQDEDTSIVIRTEQYASPFSQAVLTLFAEAGTGMQPLTFRLTTRSIARAASLGHSLTLLLEALEALYPDLNRDQIAMLWKWWKSGRSVKLQYLPIIQTEQKDQLAAIISNPATGRLIDQVLGPRAATWSGDLADAINALNHAGVFPVVGQQDNLGETDQNREALWLAGQVYQLLGEYIPLPYPLSTIALTDETVGMTPARQAVRGEHLARIRERLQSLLDGFPYLPPPTPTDPEQWTEQISAAIDDQSSLIIRYHSAGRNVETSRRIRPYWEETHRGVRYLRAECIDSGAILVFRLDRIIDLQQSGN